MARKLVDVAAGVLTLPDGRYLLGQRADDTVYAGYWEFPGGKLEADESPAQALCRELDEELGIQVTHLRPWLRREHVYEHAHVCLHFFEVTTWRGEIHDKVHGALAWVWPDASAPAPMLPANGPILKALRLPRLMGITRAGDVGVERQLAELDAALAGGLRLVQVREPTLDRATREQFARDVARRVHACGGLVLMNGDIALAHAVGADGVHLPARQLAMLDTRPDAAWVGSSCHDRADLERAAMLGLDYGLLGPVAKTQTHPDRPALGWTRFAELAAGLPMPVFALGGLDCTAMEPARDMGAHGLAGIRGVWGADWPRLSGSDAA